MPPRRGLAGRCDHGALPSVASPPAIDPSACQASPATKSDTIRVAPSAIMTITLAIGVQRMARRNAIIRRLPAVETLGSVTIICSDKTGTLTKNEMTVQTVLTADDTYRVDGAGYVPEGAFFVDQAKINPQQDHPVLAELLRGALLCNESSVHKKEGRWTLEGEPTEGSLVTLGLKAGFDPQDLHDKHPRIATIPFDSAHKFMATLHRDGDSAFIVMKGAPEAVLAACAAQRTRTGDVPIDKLTWGTRMHDTARLGQRLLAVAVGTADQNQTVLTAEGVRSGLTLLGVFLLWFGWYVLHYYIFTHLYIIDFILIF
jgi:magnesium-transporting ATPase (P-type)